MTNAFTPPPSAVAFRSLVEQRRAVRRFKPQLVERGVIQACLEAAVLAPSSCNLQPWQFQVIENPQLLEQLQPICLGQSAAKAPLIIVVSARPDLWKEACADVLRYWPGAEPPVAIQHFYRQIAPLQYNQGPFGLFGLFKRLRLSWLGRRKAFMRSPNSLQEMRVWAVKSTALAAQNLMLAFQSYGYSSCPMEGFDERRLRQVLPLAKQAIPIMLLAVGEAEEGGVFNERLRFPLEDCVSWH